VWNTLAHLADWGMLVTRSAPDLPKHKGMTYFVVDMRSPGIDVRPLRQMTGEAEFNEVYLTDVRVPDVNRIGAEGEGWRVSLTTLMNERRAIGTGASDGTNDERGWTANDALSVWKGIDQSRRTAVRRDELMRLWIRGEVVRLTNARAAEGARAGNPGPEMSIAKLQVADFNQAVYSFCLDLLGADGMVGFDYTFRRPEVLDSTGASRSVQHAFLRVRANSIEGGTSEILRNVIGEQMLGLPGEPRVDKDIPWAHVPRG
jgi:alkylation response protein AidB-like acyl-CoA dehydrogenase